MYLSEAAIELLLNCPLIIEMDEGDVIVNYNLDDDQNVEAFLEHNTLLIGKTDSGRFVFAQF